MRNKFIKLTSFITILLISLMFFPACFGLTDSLTQVTIKDFLITPVEIQVDEEGNETYKEIEPVGIDKITNDLVVFNDQDIFKVSFKLFNPMDYHIIDFTANFESSTWDFEYLYKGEWKPVEGRVIRWIGTDNQKGDYYFRKVPKDQTATDTVVADAERNHFSISTISYSLNADGTNRQLADVELGFYDIYFISREYEQGVIFIETSKQYENKEVISILRDPHIDEFKVQLKEENENGLPGFEKYTTLTCDENGYYEITKPGNLIVSYKYRVAEGCYLVSYAEFKINPLKITFTEMTEENKNIYHKGSFLSINTINIENLKGEFEAETVYKETRYKLTANSLYIYDVGDEEWMTTHYIKIGDSEYTVKEIYDRVIKDSGEFVIETDPKPIDPDVPKIDEQV